jgi:predicted NACHT family NTPase
VIQKTELMLPREFLSDIANRYGLSPEQTEVFLAKFGNDKSDQEIINAFHISDGTLRYRLGEIYKKFSIGGKGTGKAHRLLSFLTGEYQKDSALGSPSSNASADDAELKSLINEQNNNVDIDALVSRVRQQRHAKIQYQCGSMRMLDIAQRVDIADIYTDVNILEEIPSQQWREISDLLQGFNPESDNFDRLGLGRVHQERLPGLDAVSRYSKLMVLGKPGSGKTTFLQWVAIKCDLGEFQLDRVPIFIGLKNFAQDTRRDDCDFRLLNYISEEFASCGIADKSLVETILTQGKALILLDGLDEVSEEDDNEVITQIRRFIEKYFKNKFIITCRIAAQKYRFQQEKFTDVEVADFKSEQVEAFAKKWFVVVARNDRKKGEATARWFIEKLNQPENQQIRELAVTPILLNLTCLVFQAKGEFPSKRSKLYEQGLDILLVRWDESRGIKRDEVYRNLSLDRKIDFLSQLAAITFANSSYFFEQGEVEQYILNYLRTIPNAQPDKATLQIDSKAVLKSIELQHGLLVERALQIYSFSHLTVQEYFTAKYFVYNLNPQSLQFFSNKIINKSWREVFLLAVGIVQNADNLLLSMKQRIDSIVASEWKLQQFLCWLRQKSLSVQAAYKPAAVRAFYFAHELLPDRYLARVLDHDLASASDLALILLSSWDRDLLLALDLAKNTLVFGNELKINRDRTRTIICSLSYVYNYDIEPQLKYEVQELIVQLPDPDSHQTKLERWWKLKGQHWIRQLRYVMIEYCNIGHNWKFSKHQKELLKQYYDANKVLVDCLKSGCKLSSKVRQEIEDNLLLPIAESENRDQRMG